MKSRPSPWQIVLAVVFALLLAYGAYSIDSMGDHLQYLIKADAPASSDSSIEENSSGGEYALVVETDDEFIAKPKKTQPNGWIKDKYTALESLCDEEWSNLMKNWTMDGVIERTTMSSDIDESEDGRITLLGKNGMQVNPLFINYGRRFFTEDLEYGNKVIILDQQLALKLFKISDPVDRVVTINEEEYTVIGIAKHHKAVGDYTDYGAYIPLMSVIDTSIPLDIIQVEADPKNGVGAATSFATTVQNWQGGGTIINIGKEGMAAGLWLRMLIFIIGMTAALRIIKTINHKVKLYIGRCQSRLKVKYAVTMIPEVAGVVLLFALGYGISAGLIAGLMNYIIKPVYTFTEWIPAVLVEWSDIAAAFWKVWQEPAVIQELRSPQILGLRFYNLVIQVASAGEAIILSLMYARIRGKTENLVQGLTAMYKQGALVSVIRTTNPQAFEEQGYVFAKENDCWQHEGIKLTKRQKLKAAVPMVRIINAERILQQLPLSKKEGSFVIEITDDMIDRNNKRYEITCREIKTENSDGKAVKQMTQTIKEAEREWDLQMSISTLTRLVYGNETFHDFVESNVGFDMKMRSPAMDGLFDHHLTLSQKAL